MNATINELWETGREVITVDNNDTDRLQTIKDLKKCSNVIIGEKIPDTKITEVLIDDRIYWVQPITVRHPADRSTMYVLEVLN